MKGLLGMHKIHSPIRTAAPKPQISSLTSLRFFAALGIFFLHANNHSLFNTETISYIDLSKCVSFFFALSGFVLFYSYSDKNTPIVKFYLLRLMRVWPITLISILAILLVLPQHIYLPSNHDTIYSSFSFIANILCIQSLIPVPNFYFGYNAVCWSISVEIIFYLLFPILKRLSILKLSILIVLNSLLAISIGQLLDRLPILHFSLSDLDAITLEGFTYINPFFRLPEFLCGILACHLFRIANHSKFLTLSSRISSLSKVVFSITHIFVILSLTYLAFSRSSYFPSLSLSAQAVINQLKSGLLFSCVIFSLACYEGPFLRILSSKLLLSLGKISFSFYLFHQPIMILASQLGGINVLGYNILYPSLSIVLIFTLLVSFAFYEYVERPIYSISRKLFSV